ncbi:MAG: hypothetical protein ABR520_07760, partial [Mycobacteriales bacterium]
MHGLLYVPGAAGAAGEAAAHGACEDCVWQVERVCYDSGLTGPNTMHCDGTSVGCGAGEQKFQVFLTTSTTARTLVDSFCRGDLADIVTTATLTADARRYLKDVAVPPTTVRIQPRGPSVVRLAAYFEAVGTTSASGDFGPAALRISISVQPTTYTWDFG